MKQHPNLSDTMEIHFSAHIKSKWVEKGVVLSYTQLFENPDSFHMAPLIFPRWDGTQGGLHHFPSHSVDQSSVRWSPTYKAGLEMQPIVCPGRRERI